MNIANRRTITDHVTHLEVSALMINRLLIVGAIYLCTKCHAYHPSLCHGWTGIHSLIDGVSNEQVTEHQ
jgi:hypothetical protein